MSSLKPSKEKTYCLGINGKIYGQPRRVSFEGVEHESFTRRDLEGGEPVKVESEEKDVEVILKFRPSSETFFLNRSDWKEPITGSFREVKSKSRNSN